MIKLLAVSSCVLLALPRASGQPWREPIETWSEADARRVLSSSPWAKRTVARSRAGFAPVKVIVRWESAAPVRQARQKIGGAQADVEAKNHYTVAIIGLTPEDSQVEASLQYCDRDPVAASAVEVLKDSVIFRFPAMEGIRTPGVFRYQFGITLKPNEFLFAARIGRFEIRQKFPLRDMLYFKRLAI